MSVHYTTWAEATGEELDNTRESREPAQIIVSRGAPPRPLCRARVRQKASLAVDVPANAAPHAADAPHRAGLGAALLTMTPGERALVRVDASGAYGEAGNFSFPAVAPGAALLYDVELLAAEHASGEADVKARGDMLWEERMAAAAKYRDAGNDAFRAGDSAAAWTQYTAGLSFIDDGMMAQLMGSYMEESAALKAALHSNCAAAALLLGRHDDALVQASAALALAPKNAKALYRKGKAHAALGQDDAAREALTKAAALDPTDGGIKAALRALDACVPTRCVASDMAPCVMRAPAACVTCALAACSEEAAKREAAKRAFGGLFGAAPPSPPASDTAPVQEASSTASASASGGVIGRLGAWWRGSS